MGHYGYCWPDPEHKLGYDCVAPGSRYSVCVYFAVMTITSIGYGDIAATPKLPSEQIVATLLMLVRRLPPPTTHPPPLLRLFLAFAQAAPPPLLASPDRWAR